MTSIDFQLPSDDETGPVVASAAAPGAPTRKRPAASTGSAGDSKQKKTKVDNAQRGDNKKPTDKPVNSESEASSGHRGGAPMPSPAPMPSTGPRKRMLELFSGTGSVGKAFMRLGWQVISVDVTGKAMQPTYEIDVLKWKYMDMFPPGHFSVIWASPPCVHYSLARTTATTHRDLVGADRLVRKTLDIVKFYNPRYFFVESPQSGLLKTRPVIQGYDFCDLDYCKYGAPCRKRTRFWGACSGSLQLGTSPHPHRVVRVHF